MRGVWFAELTAQFPDGVWLIELAPVGDRAAVPDVVATTLGVTAQAGLSVTASVVRALSGRRLLILLDNCEHVLVEDGVHGASSKFAGYRPSSTKR